jgi:hypothetical protein
LKVLTEDKSRQNPLFSIASLQTLTKTDLDEEGMKAALRYIVNSASNGKQLSAHGIADLTFGLASRLEITGVMEEFMKKINEGDVFSFLSEDMKKLIEDTTRSIDYVKVGGQLKKQDRNKEGENLDVAEWIIEYMTVGLGKQHRTRVKEILIQMTNGGE